MAKDKQIAVRMNERTYDAVEQFAEKYELTNAEAVRRITEARLSGEGYLSGPTVADGGVAEKVDSLESTVDGLEHELEKQLESTVDGLENELEEHTEQYQNDLSIFYSAVALSLFWIGTVQVVTAPWWLITASGLAVLGAVLAGLARVSRWFL